MQDNFKEELFTFVHKVIPNINASLFQPIKVYQNNQYQEFLIVFPKNNYYISWYGNKGSNEFDDYYERKFYTIKLLNDGFYEVVYIIQTKFEYVVSRTKNDYMIRDKINNMVNNVSCKDFYSNFYIIKRDFSLLLKDEPEIVKQPEIFQEEYCIRGISLMKS